MPDVNVKEVTALSGVTQRTMSDNAHGSMETKRGENHHHKSHISNRNIAGPSNPRASSVEILTAAPVA